MTLDVEAFHERHAGITEDLLLPARSGDDDRCFVRPPDPDLVLSSFYAPDATDWQRAQARQLLTEPLEYPLRRRVWRRP